MPHKEVCKKRISKDSSFHNSNWFLDESVGDSKQINENVNLGYGWARKILNNHLGIL